MALSYTVGNWAVRSNEVDTIAQTKNVAVPDLDYQHDFSVKSEGADVVELVNTTGSTLQPVEQMRYIWEKVNDIYRKSPTLSANRLPSAVGAKILAEDINILSASNESTGAEAEFPIRVWTCMESSTHNVVTGAALKWALERHISQLYATGLVDASMLIKLFRRDLDPTK